MISFYCHTDVITPRLSVPPAEPLSLLTELQLVNLLLLLLSFPESLFGISLDMVYYHFSR